LQTNDYSYQYGHSQKSVGFNLNVNYNLSYNIELYSVKDTPLGCRRGSYDRDDYLCLCFGNMQEACGYQKAGRHLFGTLSADELKSIRHFLNANFVYEKGVGQSCRLYQVFIDPQMDSFHTWSTEICIDGDPNEIDMPVQKFLNMLVERARDSLGAPFDPAVHLPQ
jgi:hypothetical protein